MNSPLRIVAGDCEPDMRQFFYRTLTHEGHRVVAVAENSRQLITECERHRPDLVITEVKMPDMDGLAAIHEICAVNPVPSIIVSSTSRPEILVRAGQELVFAFLVKPIKMDDLRPAIWMTMKRYREMVSLRHQLDRPQEPPA